MKAPHVIGLSMLAGVALGATAIQGLHAQAKPPVYVIVDFSDRPRWLCRSRRQNRCRRRFGYEGLRWSLLGSH
jgi:hypothetical protein